MVNVIVSNYTNKHLTFHKGKYIGHLEPLELDSTDQGETHQANSITLKKMISKTVTSDTFNPPHHEILTPVQNSLKLLLEEYDLQVCPGWNIHWHDPANKHVNWHRYHQSSVTETIPYSNEALQLGQEGDWKIISCQGNPLPVGQPQ